MNRPPDFHNKAIILGVKIDDKPMDFILNEIEQSLGTENQLKIFTPNPEICRKAEKDENYRHVLNNASINTPDGFGLKLGAKILGETLENRVAGSDLTPAILKEFNRDGIKIFIVLRSDSLSKPTNIQNLFKEKYSKIKIKVGVLNKNNYDDCDKVLNDINSFEPQIIFVCLGAPDQEIWINKYLKFLYPVKAALGIGGTFDFLTGQMKRAPRVIRELGMEWFYRLYKEPTRLKRIKNATADFLLICHKWKKRINSEYRENVVGIVINEDGKFLVQKNPRFKNHWQFPQGGIDEKETIETAVVREVSEETGIPENKLQIIKSIPESHIYDWPEYARLIKGFKGQKQQAYLLKFIGNNQEIDLSNSHEAEEIKWVNKEDLIKTIHPHRHEFLKKILKHI